MSVNGLPDGHNALKSKQIPWVRKQAMRAGKTPQDFSGHLEVAVRTILSPVETSRSQNEDNYLLVDSHGLARFMVDQQDTQQRLTHWPTGHVRLAVLDGMGGHSFGREATEGAVLGMLAIPPDLPLQEWCQQLDDLHSQLHATMHQQGVEPGCTLTALDIPPGGEAKLYHVSDSRLYRVSDQAVDYLTIDHVPATKFAMRGLLSADEWHWQVHEQSGYQISQAFVLGNTLSDPTLYDQQLDEGLYALHDANLPAFLQGLGDRRLLPLEPGVVYLLATDGLWNLDQPHEFVSRWPTILGRSDRPLKALLDDLFVELILTASASVRPQGDNTTVVAFRWCP